MYEYAVQAQHGSTDQIKCSMTNQSEVFYYLAYAVHTITIYHAPTVCFALLKFSEDYKLSFNLLCALRVLEKSSIPVVVEQ